MNNRLDGKVALVTGGTSGIGLATAERFVAEGAAHVFITGRRQGALDEATAAIGRSVTAVRADSADLGDLDRLFARITDERGRLDVLFVNAGGGSLLPLGAITEEQYEDTFGRNVKGVLFTVQKALPLLLAAGEGASVILNASTASITSAPGFSVYSASKAAVRAFARGWILDLKGRGVRVNVISPGVVPTPGYDLLGLTTEQIREFVDAQAAVIPLGRVGTPEDIAKAVAFLASDDSSYVNGVELFVDGGLAQF